VAPRRAAGPRATRTARPQDVGHGVGQPGRCVGVGRAAGAAQQQQRLAHLRPVEEALAAPHEVGHTGVRQRRLVQRRLRVHPVEDGDLAGRRARPDELRAPGGDRGGLGRLVRVLGERGVGAGRPLRHEVQPRRRRARLSDDAVGQPHHLRRRPVVAHQAHLGGTRVPLPEAHQVVGRRTGEGVDRLLGVADDAQVVAPAEPGVEQPLLQRRDVLVLVDDERAVAGPELLGHGGRLLEAPRGEQQQVVEVGHALRVFSSR
jgi:hypothetical protein